MSSILPEYHFDAAAKSMSNPEPKGGKKGRNFVSFGEVVVFCVGGLMCSIKFVYLIELTLISLDLSNKDGSISASDG